MRTIAGSASIREPLERPILTVGNFDGIHLGHRAILDTVTERARAVRGEAVVYTFEPHPRKVLSPKNAPRLLTTLEQKLELLALAGVDAVIVEPFDLAFARTPADDFIREFVHARIRPLEVYVGYDFHFGRDREGSMRLLTELGPRLGFSVTIIPEVVIGEGDVNSTRIRQLLGEAAVGGGRDPARARLQRARPGGEGRGAGPQRSASRPRTWSWRTRCCRRSASTPGRLRLLDDGDPPAGATLPAVTNVGTRPTFGASDRVVVEAHLIDFSGDLYGRRVELSFRFHLRPERRFAGVEALRAQIDADRAEARRRLAAG